MILQKLKPKIRGSDLGNWQAGNEVKKKQVYAELAMLSLAVLGKYFQSVSYLLIKYISVMVTLMCQLDWINRCPESW